jgi:cytidyltransferase-like protein
MAKKVMVSGCFDLLHSGHIAFFEEASSYGDLYVALGSDQTVFDLKGRVPVNNENERLYMVKSVGCVTDAFISKGSGILDFFDEFKALKPDAFVVNADGNTPGKQKLCETHGVEYIVLKREPRAGLTPRSTTALRGLGQMPYRIDLAGGWLDQPWVSKHYPGSVITISLEPTIEFNERSGMASSTRRSAIDIWGPRLPAGDYEKLAKILFCYDNPPGTEVISGSQDAIGRARTSSTCWRARELIANGRKPSLIPLRSVGKQLRRAIWLGLAIRSGVLLRRRSRCSPIWSMTRFSS